MITIPERYIQTDGQTDRQQQHTTTYDSNTVLCVASRGKKDAPFKWLETKHTVALERLVLGCEFSPVRHLACCITRYQAQHDTSVNDPTPLVYNRDE